MVKNQLVYKEGFVRAVQAACGTGQHRGVECQTLGLKPSKGGFDRTAAARGPFRFSLNQRVKWYETTDGLVVDVLPR